MSNGRMAILAFISALASGAAHAQSVSAIPEDPTKPALNLSDPRLSFAPPSAPSNSADGPFVNRTSIEHTFGPQPITAAVGYLCGLQPLTDRTSGPASTFGPLSTFLGGKLTYAFK